MAAYKIERTQPTLYFDKRGNPLNGYLIQVAFPEFDEVHELRLPSLDPKIVEKAIDALLENRQALNELGA